MKNENVETNLIHTDEQAAEVSAAVEEAAEVSEAVEVSETTEETAAAEELQPDDAAQKTEEPVESETAETTEDEQPTAVEGVTVEEALNDIRNEVESLERTAQIFRTAGRQNTTADGAGASEEDDFAPLRTIFANRRPVKKEEAEKGRSFIFYGSKGEKATLKIENDRDGNMDRFVDRMLESVGNARAEAYSAKKKRRKKGVSTAAGLLLSLLVLGSVSYYILFAGSLRALVSIDEVEVNANAYSMTYNGDYGLDEFLEDGGAGNEKELMDRLGMVFSNGAIRMPELNGSAASAGESVLYAGDSTRYGGTLTGRGYSTDEELMSMIVVTRMSSGRETVSTVNLNWLGYTPYNRPGLLNGYAALASVYLPLDGMNDSGLCVAALEVPGEPQKYENTVYPDLTITTAVRVLLDRAGTVEKAIELLGSYDVNPAFFGRNYHLLINDRSGESVVVEWVGGEMKVTDSTCASNGFVCPEGAGMAAENDASASRMESLTATYSRFDGHMTESQMVNAIRHNTPSGDSWRVVYNTGRGTAEFIFDDDESRQAVVSMK